MRFPGKSNNGVGDTNSSTIAEVSFWRLIQDELYFSALKADVRRLNLPHETRNNEQ